MRRIKKDSGRIIEDYLKHHNLVIPIGDMFIEVLKVRPHLLQWHFGNNSGYHFFEGKETVGEIVITICLLIHQKLGLDMSDLEAPDDFR